jgi:2-polyprenyl-3-methyl-5-hydroxy-6-metoxy-1,4-benzoquinol methylase
MQGYPGMVWQKSEQCMEESVFRYDTFNPYIFAEVPEKIRVLDVGCATGLLGKRLREEKGCFVVGIELDEKMAQEARRHLNQVIIADLDEPFVLNSSTFDVIVFSDILEHLKNPAGLLKKLEHNLSDDGFYLISVPNIAFIKVRFDLLLGKFDYNSRGGIMDETHLHFYTRKTLLDLLKNVDFEAIFLRGYNLVKPRFFFLKILGHLFPTVFTIQFLVKAKKR